MQALGRAAAELATGLDRLGDQAAAALSTRVPEFRRAVLAAGEDPHEVSLGALSILLAAVQSRRAVPDASSSIRLGAAARFEAGVAFDTVLEAIAVHSEVLRHALDAQIRQIDPPGALQALPHAQRRLDRAAQDLVAESARGYLAAFAERSRRRHVRAAALARVAAALGGSFEAAGTAQDALTAIAEALGVEAAGLWLHDGDPDVMLPAYTHGLRWDEDRALREVYAAPSGLLARAAGGAGAVSGEVAAGGSLRLAGVAAVAVRSRGDLLGVLVAGDRRQRQFTPDDLRFLTSAADHWAVALVRAGRHHHEARTDPLTGLVNRNELERQVERAIVSARRAGQGLTLVLAGLDEPHAVDAGLGHPAADAALLAMARAMRAAVRGSDTCARIGTGEFALLLVDTAPTDAALVIRRIERSLGAAGPRFRSGIAGWGPGMAVDELFSLADNRLHGRKRRHHEIEREPGIGA